MDKNEIEFSLYMTEVRRKDAMLKEDLGEAVACLSDAIGALTQVVRLLIKEQND